VLGDPLDRESDPGGVEAKGPAGLVPGHPLDPFGLESLDPAVDGAAAAEQQGGDGDPGVAVVQEEEDMGVEADLGVMVLAIAVQECGPLLGAEVDAALHGDAGVWIEVSIHLVLRRSALSGLRGAI
jgi:hypothetical protein